MTQNEKAAAAKKRNHAIMIIILILLFILFIMPFILVIINVFKTKADIVIINCSCYSGFGNGIIRHSS